MPVAEIFFKSDPSHGISDQTLILETRCQMVYPMNAPGWTDLRVGFFLSVCSTAVDDPASPITGLGETLDNPSHNNPAQDYPYIGIKTNNDRLPDGQGTGFIGYSVNTSNPRTGSQLVSSDQAIGTTNSNFWRPRVTLLGAPNDAWSAIAMDEGSVLGGSAFNHVQPHFPQVWDGTSAHPYATLLMLRITRPNSSSNALTISINQGTDSGDVLFSNTPTMDLLSANLTSYPTVVQTKTVNYMADIPDALYLYWPFYLSRLRCHALGFMKYH